VPGTSVKFKKRPIRASAIEPLLVNGLVEKEN
jgi:hypothetical protein